MGIYANAALSARELITTGINPVVAWDSAIRKYTPSEYSKIEVCPKAAFLGLCEAGYIQGVNVGTYTKSVKNKKYAIKAVEILRRDSPIPVPNDYKKINLWRKVLNELHLKPKSYNGQMDVVLALWNGGHIIR
ncbi:MAG: hypothetical protein Q8R90_09575 [Bacteroidales bacterium]|nr:hypothetical protein [Bacteroidales bacterium]